MTHNVIPLDQDLIYEPKTGTGIHFEIREIPGGQFEVYDRVGDVTDVFNTFATRDAALADAKFFIAALKQSDRVVERASAFIRRIAGEEGVSYETAREWVSMML